MRRSGVWAGLVVTAVGVAGCTGADDPLWPALAGEPLPGWPVEEDEVGADDAQPVDAEPAPPAVSAPVEDRTSDETPAESEEEPRRDWPILTLWGD